MLEQIKKEIRGKANPEKAKLLQRFFKTGKGEYGEGDIFLGLVVPIQRKIAKKYTSLKMQEVQSLLSSKIHEERLISLLILMQKYKIAEPREKEEIFRFYLLNTKNINNWDLVDLSCIRIVGEHLLEKDRSLLYKLAKSRNLWERRISIISTGAFIRQHDFKDTIKISEMLLKDKHDLIHKAVGWMLREVGKRDEKELIKFLDKYYNIMPRTMLRYSIERLPEKTRKFYLKKS